MEDTFLLLENEGIHVRLMGQEETFFLYTLKSSGRTFRIGCPFFEIDGVTLPATIIALTELKPPYVLPNGCTEYRYGGPLVICADISLEIIIRMAEKSPVLRLAYVLHSQQTHRLTRSEGRDALTYLTISLAELPLVTEVQCAEFIELIHSYCLAEHQIAAAYFAQSQTIMGPILLGSDQSHTLLLAYEHGSQVPDAFLQFQLTPERQVSLQAAKGNYLHAQPLDIDHTYTTIWLQLAAVEGNEEDMARAYREFVLKYQSLSAESRQPYLFYNTWNLQERTRWWYQGAFLDPLYQERILTEIEIANRLGIEVFVLDTGWYEKTGDWHVNLTRFPDGLKAVKALLDRYHMKLGLWFGPTSAALSSEVLQKHPEYLMSWQGKAYPPVPIWETEESQPLCLVSSYSDFFADRLIQLARELGVTYFKWDAVDQYGCDAPGHWHGDDTHSAEERADSYAFGLVRQMTRIVERVCAAVPDALFDFDITEAHRAVGLSFLSAGKYFLINNGPYYESLDIPFEPSVSNGNLYFFPGQARGWVTRPPLLLDKWLPSTLFLTHYYPDDPASSQIVNLATLILGHNGIWGDLLRVSETGLALIADIIQRYKMIRADMTRATLIRWGTVGGSPEIYEKIDEGSGRGAVILFAPRQGSYRYVTEHQVVKTVWCSEGVTVTPIKQGKALLQAEFAEGGAKIIFFGIE